MTSPAPDAGIVITTSQMYEEVRRVGDGLIRLEAKLDALTTADRDVDSRLGDHESRLRRLEAGRWPLPTLGALTGLAALGVAVVPLVSR
ncbi:hypothetical protein [Kitasatospora sp. A2-31]|uniref:hypothetical protein n=1 Tax=Kitasatospora sp. A2-31 TaxID=2916414 RepID=UPI001EEE9A38|nr:hypothetical protein [Kitasatospora sp. A2-31]MCG6499475.1 hypothetical protein [Kitasatospora sp. A2-31]